MGKIDCNQILLPLFLLLCITTSIVPLCLAFDLINLDTYDSLFAILDKAYIHTSYFVAVIMDQLDYLHFSIGKLYASLVTSLSYLNLLVIIFVGYLFAASKETLMKKYNTAWMSIVYIYICGYVTMASVLVFGFKGASVNELIYLFHYIGWIMLIVHISMIGIASVYFIKIIKNEIYPILKIKCST